MRVAFNNFHLAASKRSVHDSDVHCCDVSENYPVPGSRNLSRPMKTPPHNLGRSHWSRAPAMSVWDFATLYKILEQLF